MKHYVINTIGKNPSTRRNVHEKVINIIFFLHHCGHLVKVFVLYFYYDELVILFILYGFVSVYVSVVPRLKNSVYQLL